MPIFEYNGKKYNVKDEHIDSFMRDYPDASTIMEREGQKYRVRSADYNSFISGTPQQDVEKPSNTGIARLLSGMPGVARVASGIAGIGSERLSESGAPEENIAISPTNGAPLTEEDKDRMSAEIALAKLRIDRIMDDFNEGMETQREYIENAPLGSGQTAEGRMMYNPESGHFEQTYITPFGNRYTNKELADIESFRYRQAADMSVSGQLRRARQKLAELQRKKAAARDSAHDRAQEFRETKLTGFGQVMVGGQIYQSQVVSDPATNAYDTAIHETEELIARLERQQQRDNGEDEGFWRGLGSIELSDFDFGFGDLRRNFTKMYADHYTGENATDEQREAYNAMLEATHENEQATQMYPDSWWYNMGVMTKDMLPFALDFITFRGTTSLPSVFTKGGTKVATKVFGKEVVEDIATQGFKRYVKNNGIRGLGQYAGNWTIKSMGVMGDDLLIRAPLMTNTVRTGKTASDIIDRRLGDVEENEDGTYEFSNEQSWSSAIWQGEANAIIENYSEMFGAHLPQIATVGNLSRVANVIGAKRIGAVLSKAEAGALSGIMGQTQQLFNKMGVSDYFGEVTEEYYGQLWRTMLNLDDAYRQNPDGTRTNLFATGEFHGDIWGGMALSMGVMGIGKNSITGVQYVSMKHGVNKADVHAGELLGKDVWEPMRATIDLASNDNMGAMAEVIINDKDFTEEERAAVLTYMERTMMLRGFNLGTLAQSRGAEPGSDVQSMNESYIDGYNMESSQEMNDAKNMFDYQRQRVSAIVDEDMLAFMDSNPMNAIAEVRANGIWNDEARATILDYLNAKQVYDGMIQRVRDDIDGRIDQSNAMVNARTNRTTGMIQGATMKQDDRRVYVINGNLVQYADGSGIDIEASDKSIIVRDAETGALEQVSPDAILNIDEALDPITEMQTAADAIRQQYAQEAANRIDGVVTFNPGDTYTITGDDAQIQVQIVANDEGVVDNGDGTVNVSDGTNVFPLAKETIQQQAEAAQLARVAQFEQQRAAENAAYQQAIEEESRPQYALNDLVSLRDENGNAVRGNITTDADADGRYEVYTEAPINGKRVNLFTRDELDSMLMEHNGERIAPVGKTDELVSINEYNLLSLQKELEDELPERISQDNNGPQDVETGSAERKIQDAAIRCQESRRAYEEARSGSEQLRAEDSWREVEARDIEAYAKESGQWLDYVGEVMQLGEPGASGNENDTYISGDGDVIYKVNNLMNSKDIMSLLEKVTLHNSYFPETAYELEGFTGFGRGIVYPVLKQRYVDNATFATVDEIDQYMVSLGFEQTGEATYSNQEVTISDLRPRNVLKDSDGDIYVVDAEFKRQEISKSGAEAPADKVTQPAMDRIPKDDQGNPLYEQTDSDTAWDAIVEQTDGDEVMAQTVADGMLADKEAALKKLEKSKSKGGVSIAEKIAAEKERKAAIDAAQQELNIWKKIAGTANRRRMDAEAERRRVAEEAAALRKAEEAERLGARIEAERIEREALNGVPDMVDDTPQDARARGYRRVSGHKIDRQEPLQAVQGKEVAVRFSDDAIANGRVAVIDATQLQPSHIQGQRNPLHFIDEAQPKERNDEASVMSARKIAGNIRPEEITSSVTAYTGAPTVNARGEAIQGNNRSDALRLMWESHQDQAAQYKQYLTRHAEEFGLNADDVAAMERPVLVNMLDVDDAEAITLGQFVAQDTESGGTERIKPKNALQKMGNDMRSFANLLLKSNDEDTSFAGLVDNNGVEVLKWMSQRGYITPTQYKSAFDSKGNLTAEAKNDLRGIMYQSIFKGGSTRLEEMFNAMPAKAQKAILATAFRDYDSPNADRMIEEIQNSIRAFYALSQSEDFVNAKTFKDARLAVEGWKIQYQIDDVTGESYLPAENFSNFALLLATMYKGDNQSVIQGTFNKLYDLIQGTQEPNLFEQPDNTPRSLAQAIYETLNITYDGQQRSNVLVGDSSASQRGQQGSTGNAATGERIESGERTADSAGSIDGDSRGIRIEGENRGNQGEETTTPQNVGTSLFQYFTGTLSELISQAKQSAEGLIKKVIAPVSSRLKEDLSAKGIVVDEEYKHVIDNNAIRHTLKKHSGKNEGKRGQVPIVDADFDRIADVVEHYDGVEVLPGNTTAQKIIYQKAYPDGTVMFVEEQRVGRKELAAVTMWKKKNPTLTDANRTETTQISDLNEVSDNKDTTISPITNELGEKSVQEQIQAAEAEVNTNPTEAQKEAGNYKKGHVQIRFARTASARQRTSELGNSPSLTRSFGTFNVTIEQPRGSIRSGVDKGGKKWEIEMQNTYGYIRGTEGVDGDHIDVFLSNDIDGWNGRQVYVIDQRNEDGSFDEHKVMLGFNDIKEAEEAYLSNYEEGWQGLGAITGVAIEDFEKWIASSHRKTKAFAEYKSVKITEGESASAEASTISQGTDQVSDQDNDAPYSIAPAQYTTKKSKVLDMHLVKFAGTLTKEQQRAAKELAKADKGWYDREQGGFMMRSEESAKQLADTILNNDDAVSDAQPVSLADTRKIVETEQQVQLTNPSGNRLVTDERYAKLRERMRKKLGGQMNIGIDPEILAIGTEMAVYHLEKGARKFTEYAKAMIADLGDAIRPYLKAFYNGARNLPEVESSEIAADMTPYDEVQQFNVATFDKEHSDPFTTAEIVVAEQAHQEEAEQAKQEIINQRNTERRNEDEQTSASTEAIASQAETVADKAESDIETATTEEQLNDVVATIDKQIEEVNKQLALLGYYEADIDDSQFHESYGYMRSAEKKAVKDADTLAKRIVKDLGIDPASIVDKKGKKRKVIAQANIAPAGGDVSIRLPLTASRELYIDVLLEPDYEGGNRDNLFIDHIYLRIEDPTAGGYKQFVGRNVWLQADATYTDMLDEIRAEIIQHVPEFDLPTRQSVSETEQKQPKAKKSKKKAVNLQQSDELGLFDSLFEETSTVGGTRQNESKHSSALIGTTVDNETNNEDGLQRTDAERSEGVSANGNRHEQGLSRGTETSSESEQQDSRGTDNGGERTGDAVDRTVRPRLSDTVTEQSIEGKRKKEVERNRKLANELKGVTLHLFDKLGGEREISGIVYYELANVFHCNDNVSGPFQATRKKLDAILKVARKSDGKETFKPKNTRNNHSERGKDHAPTSVDARIEANIKAIELAKQLLESGEQATEKQMQTLRKFSGWGGLGKAFSEGTYYAPNNTAKKLRELLGERAYQEAVMSANSAYYTPAYVVDTLWDIAEKMGFEGGNILEGSAGIGNILGQMPTHISERSDIHAIEIDGTSGSILSLLYPDANVEIQGFEQTHIDNGTVDLAITNVPFVTGLRVNDTTGDKDLSKKFHNIHDFCIAKNVRKLREGGLGIFITSNGTLDSSKKLRDWIVSEGGADFVGAFRMHNKTFGGTGVTSDIIVIRKRVNGQKSANAIDVSTVTGERMAEYDTGETRKVKGKETPVIKQLSMDYNRYFVEHPENMAGEMHFAFEKGDTFRPTSKGLYPKQDKKQEQMLAEFVQSFTAEEFGERTTDDATGFAEAMQGKKLGELFVKDGKLYTYTLQGAKPLEVNANKVKGHTKVECFEAYTAIKEALAEVLAYQTSNESDEGLKPLLDSLNRAYDDFVATYGHFNKNTAIAFLRNDVDYASVFALERFEETADAKGNKVQKFGKTDVFSKRVVEKEKEPTPTNVKDGIIASIFKFGRVDVPYIAEQLGVGIEDVKKEIIESGYGFENPATRQIEASYQYLSGNVREKLRQAEENNENGAFDRNIKALQEVMPMEIPAHLIDFTLGSSWIDPKLYEDYVKELTEVAVQFTAVGGTWFMKEPYFTNYEKNRAMGVTSEMLGRTIMGHTLIEAAIQNRSITVSTTKKRYDGSTETITDKEATQACAAKIDEIRQDFKDWARQKMQSDPEMSALIERIYNDTFNNFVPMSIPDEFVPEYFGGASHKFKMRPHQGKAIVRGTQQPLMLAHEVGTGKTFTLISTAMEMRRLGTARKPMIVVQNATVGQFVASAKELYPNAKILTLEEADRTAEGRKNFYAKIRYNDWDMIVVPQSTFEFIPDSEEREMAFVQEKIEEKMLILEKMKEEDPDGKSMITRQAEREIELLEEQLAGITDKASKKRTANDEKKRAVALQNAEVKAMEMLDRRTDDVENFDDMGIDALLVDEAHEYKHLGFATAMQRGVKGVDPSYSKKSQGVFLKTQAVLEKNNGRNVIFATGTPISNTAAEIWTFMRYLMPADTMKEYGIYYFDDFVRNFGNIQQMLEFTTSGKFKENNRFAGYVNLPELVRIWSGVSDTVLTKEAGGVSDKIPEMEGGKAQDLYLPQTRALRSIMKFVKGELEKYEQMSGKEKKENSHIPLTMYGIAKAAAVDARLVQADAEDDPHSKTNEAVRQTLRALNETANYKGTVAIFADNYQNKHSGFNIYDDIRDKLIAEGVPADEIVVMRSGMTVKKKLEIFEKVNRGEVRVILGSTFTLGTGVNIQERLHTLIHLDAPNRPMDYTQRNGRILRQGNLHKAMGKPVRILRFGVEDSLDVTAYQRLKTKGAIADSIMNGKQMMSNSMTNRVLEEEEDVFGDTVAQLSGSEYAMLKNNAEKNMRKYASRKKQYEADQTYIHNAKPRVKAFIKDAEKRIEDNSRYLEAVRAAFPDGKFKEIVIGKHRFTSVEAMEDLSSPNHLTLDRLRDLNGTRSIDDFFKEHNKSVLAEMKQMKDGDIAGEQKRELTIQIGDFAVGATSATLGKSGSSSDSHSLARDFTFVVTTKLTRQTMRDGATLFNDVERKMTYSCAALGIEDIPVRQNLLRNAIEDITHNVITGRDFAERLEAAERSKKHNEAEMEQLLSREGKPFEYEEELAQAKAQFEEYAELMKKELEEKEAKYAEMDATVEAANDLDNAEEDDTLYRSDDATKNRIEALFNQAILGEFKGKPISIGRLTDEGKAYLEQISGVAFRENVDFVLNPSDLMHIYKDHFGNNEKDKGQNIPLDIEDIRSLADVISSPDKIIFFKEGEGSNRNMFYFFKEAEDGTYNLMEIYSDRKGNLTAKTFYKTRKGSNQRVIDIEKSLLLTSETSLVHPLSGAKIPQMFETTSVEDNYSREGEGAYTDDEVSFENDPISKVLGKPRFTRKQRREFAERERRRMVERVESLAKKLNLDNVEIVTDASTLEGKKQRAKGFYTKSTGKITIVIPNHVSTFDVEQTLLHEAVAHYGLRQLFGEHFDMFLDNVFNNADEAIRQRIVALAAKNGWDFHKATEEYLAMLAENTEFENTNASWWRQIKDFFLNMLHKIGFEDLTVSNHLTLDQTNKFNGSRSTDGFRGVTLTDNELRYILWRSYENLAEPGRYRSILGEAADVAKQYELGVGNYSDTNLNPNFAAESDDDLYRYGDPEIHERELARDRYERRMRSGLYQSQEALQDSMLSLQEAMLMIDKKAKFIEDIAGFENAYLGENALASVNQNEVKMFVRNIIKPMLDAVAKLARNEAEREELTDYMMAKHGLERNAYMRNEAINNGATDADQTDYAGLTALTGMDDVADAEAEAQRIVDDYEQAHDTTDLWEKVNAVSKAILQKSYDCGMMSKETFDKVSDMYEFYIPLRGFDEKTSAEAYAYLSHKHSAFNAPIKKAEGRRSKADDPFANLQSMAEGAIMQGNRNKLVKQRFLNFALNHPSDLVSVSDIWVEYDAVTDEWKPVFPDNIESTDTPEEVEQKMQDFETKMESLAQQHPDQYKRGKDAIGIPYRIVESRDMRQHQVVVKRGGRDYVITINGNPRLAQALNGQTNPDADISGTVGYVLQTVGDVNRTLSSVYTTLSPDFVASNFMRDCLYANTMVWIKENPNYALRFNLNYSKLNPAKMKILFAKHRKGTLDMNDEVEAMFYQFMMNGGETGYHRMLDIDQHKKEIEKALKAANSVIPYEEARKCLGEWIGEIGRGIESQSRFAAFITSRQFGRDMARSIYDAKEISVNFNKKGAGDKFLGAHGQTFIGNLAAGTSWYGRTFLIFWNAAIQGTFGNFGKNAKRHPAKALAVTGAFFSLGLLLAALGASGGDDEDENSNYYNLPEHVRRNNIVIKGPGNSWIKIPLSIEYRAIYGMGELCGSTIFHNEELEPHDLLSQISQILPVDMLAGQGEDDFSWTRPFIPSIAKTYVEAQSNRSWTGLPIWKDTPYNKNMPEWTKAYRNANKQLIGLSEALNEADGKGNAFRKGKWDFNPAKVEYLLSGYLGGFWDVPDQLIKIGEMAFGSRDFDWRYIPLVNRAITNGDERTMFRDVNNQYFELKEERDETMRLLREYKKASKRGLFEYAEEMNFLYNSPEYTRALLFDTYNKNVEQFNDFIKSAPNESVADEFRNAQNEMKRVLVNAIEDTRKRK